MEEKLSLNKIVGMNLKRIIRQSRYRTQEEFAYEYGYIAGVANAISIHTLF